MEQVLVNSMKGAPVNQCWTGKDLAAEFGDNSSLGLVLRRLEEKTWSQGKVICQVRLNGEILSEDQEKTLGDLALTEIKNLSIAIENPDRLISSTLPWDTPRKEFADPQRLHGTLEMAYFH